MNPQAIMTPGGIADQLTRGLSGLGQSFNQREQILRQGQRDRMMDDRYGAEMALRQQAQEQQTARQVVMDERSAARDALEQQRYGDQQQFTRDALARRESEHEAGRGQREFQAAREGYVPEQLNEVMPGQDWRAPLQAGQPAYGPPPGSPAWQGLQARQALQDRGGYRGRPLEDQLAIDEAKASNVEERDRVKYAVKEKELEGKASARELEALRKQRKELAQSVQASGIGRPVAGADSGGFWEGSYEPADVESWHKANPGYSPSEKQLADLDARIAQLEGGAPQSAAGALGGSEDDSAMDAAWGAVKK